MFRPENHDILASGQLKYAPKPKFPFLLLGILLVAGFLAFKIIPLGMIFLIILPLISLSSYYINYPFNSRRNLHSYLFITVFLVAIIVGVNRKQNLSFLSKPFIEGEFKSKQIIIEHEGTYYWEDGTEFEPKNSKEKNIMKVMELMLLILVVGSILLSYFVDKWYNQKKI